MSSSLDPYAVYLPIDRRLALAREGEALPSRDQGVVLFLDISGFTPLTQALMTALGTDRGAEALIGHLNRVYDQLIDVIHRYRGAVIGFSGDAITCWFSQDAALQATTAAIEAQEVMAAMADVVVAPVDAAGKPRAGEAQRFPLSIKVAIASGPARRFLVGLPHLMRLEVLAGGTIDLVAMAEQQAQRGEIVLTAAVVAALDERLQPSCWREADGQRFAGILPADRQAALEVPAATSPWPVLTESLPPDTAETWLPVAVRRRLRTNAFLAEFRNVVALFLRFGGIDYDRDDDAGEALSRYVDWIQQIISRYGGTILQLTFGDKGSYAYASFGAPITYADNAVRAVAAALALLRPPPSLDFVSPPQIGLASGAMCAGAYGGTQRRVYGVIGHKTNLAARLMMHAAPGSIWCDKVVQRAACDTWSFASLPPIKAKGVRGDVAVFSPTGARVQSATHAIRPQHRIGRDDIFDVMIEQLDIIGACESSSLILEGEAGMGKSHLLGVLAQEAQEREFGVLMGAGLSIEQHSPYRAWREPLRGLLGVQADQVPAAQQQQIQRYFAAHLPDESERIPLLGAILDLPMEETGWTQELAPELRQESLQGLVISLLRARAERGPVCLILEDAQWFDSLTWELLMHIGRAMEVSLHGLLLALSLRPRSGQSSYAPQASYHQALAALSRHMMRQLPLRPMPLPEIKALVAHELGCDADALGPGVTSLLQRRTGGNPFFALELLRLMREQGLLEQHEAAGQTHWRLGKGAESLASLPTSMEGLLLARIDQLPPLRQQILKVAAVIGQTFSFPQLRHVLSPHPTAAPERLRAQLTTLRDDAFIALENEENQSEYAFSNNAIRDVAYRTLLYQQRQSLHRAIALWYEGEGDVPDALGSSGFSGSSGASNTSGSSSVSDVSDSSGVSKEIPASVWPLLLYHWRQAQEPGRERRWARQLGELAAAQYAHAEAVAHLGRALELTPDDEDQRRYELLLLREQVFERSGDLEAQRGDLKALGELAAALPVEARIQIRLREAHFALLTAAYDEALDAVADAHAQAQATGSPRLEAEALHLWGDIFFKQRDAASAQRRFQVAQEVAQAHQLQGLEALSLNALGKCLWRQRQHEEGLAQLQRALAQFRSLEDLRSEALVLNNIALILGEQDKRDEAIASLTQARSTCATLGDRRGEALVLGNLGMYAMENGELLEAMEHLERARVLSREVGARDNEALVLLQLGDVAKRAGDYQSARMQLDEALAIYEEIGHPFFPFVVKMVQAECHQYTGAHLMATALTKECLAAGVAEMDPSLAAEMSILLARSLESCGLHDDALTALEEAASWCAGDAKIGLHWNAARARILWRLGRLDEAVVAVTPLLPTLCLGREDVRCVDGVAEPFELYLAALEVLQAAEHSEYMALLEAAQALLDHRSQRLDELRRDAFLNDAPHHRALRDLFPSEEES